MPDQDSNLNALLKRTKGILARQCWWILGSTFVVSLAIIRASYLLPNHYRSEAVIFMANPRISVQYVVPNNTINNMEAIDALTREIFSRARLLEVVNEFNLYPGQRQNGNLAPSQRMRNDIEVLPLNKNPERRPMNAFLIAFTANDPSTAQKVTDRLTKLFINENKQNQQQLDTGTTGFLEQELRAAQVDLDRQQAALQSFTLKNLGHLPQQQTDNLQVLSGLQFQLQSIQTELTRARQQRTYLMSMLSQIAPGAADTGSDAAGSAPGSFTSLQEELTRLRRRRDDLLSRYSPQYPDVIAVDQQIADEETELKKFTNPAKAATDEAGSSSSKDVPRLPLDPNAIQLRSQLQANEIEIQDSEKQVKQLQMQIAAYQQQLALTPVRAQELDQLQRTYDLAKAHFADLLNKKTQSALATKLAAQQSSEQFQIIDPATFPSKPSGPPRRKIAVGGLACGLGLGLGLAFLFEARDRSFHSENEARAYFSIPMVVGIPKMLTVAEEHKRARRRALGWATGCLMLLLLGVAQFYVFFNG